MKLADSIEMGVRALDKVYGQEWPFWIDLETFDLSDGSYCVLGQIERNGKHAISDPYDPHTTGRSPYEYGAKRLWDTDAEEAKALIASPSSFCLYVSDYGQVSQAAKLMGFDIKEGLANYSQAFKRREKVWRRRITELRQERQELAPR